MAHIARPLLSFVHDKINVETTAIAMLGGTERIGGDEICGHLREFVELADAAEE